MKREAYREAILDWVRQRAKDPQGFRGLYDALVIAFPQAKFASREAARLWLTRDPAWKELRPLFSSAPVRRASGLREYALAQKRKGCPVCQLPLAVRQQLFDPRNNSIPREVKLGWVHDDYAVTLTPQHLETHRRERHDDAAQEA